MEQRMNVVARKIGRQVIGQMQIVSHEGPLVAPVRALIGQCGMAGICQKRGPGANAHAGLLQTRTRQSDRTIPENPATASKPRASPAMVWK
ncbi:hypothetical protein GCM10010991_27890 [Gemmobacter aquaticus]|uniref:Uncharacterized protein n=1 Tax=Gemmobacter aquaticus TaxID=490185 RepID=A0A918DD99_9RHOB|nr:hypothetical protein GCM10010991_27890 [Gemmobacter aquaticus]